MVSATTLPIGLLIYGWSVQAHAFWIVPGKIDQLHSCGFLKTRSSDLGVFIYSIGIGQPLTISPLMYFTLEICFAGANWTCIQTYLVSRSVSRGWVRSLRFHPQGRLLRDPCCQRHRWSIFFQSLCWLWVPTVRRSHVFPAGGRCVF
jgi:hypothetical protein